MEFIKYKTAAAYLQSETLHWAMQESTECVYMLFNHAYDGWLLLSGIRQVLMSCRFVMQSKQWSNLLT